MRPASVRPAIAALALVAASMVVAASPASADGGVPYTDTRAKGVIGLCDKDGNQITSGDVRTRPFVWRAVSSVAAPDGYDGKGGTATLYSYQPRKGVDANYWSGDILTASSVYSNPDHPMAAAVEQDEPLSTNLDTYPADWDGHYQLRLYLSAPGRPAYQQDYAATDLLIDGLTWKVINPQKADCSSGTAVSNATLLLPKKSKAPAAGATASAVPGTTPGTDTSAEPSVSVSADEGSVAGAAADASIATDDSSGPSPWLLIVIAAVIAVAGFLGGQAIARRRGTQAPPPDAGPTSSSAPDPEPQPTSPSKGPTS